MPKVIPNTEFEVIEKVIGRFPNGARLEELIRIGEIKLSPRTLQRRLRLLVEQGRLTSKGKGAGSKYLIHSSTASIYDGLQIPISPNSILIRNYVNQPLTNRSSVNYNRSFLEDYHPNETYYLSSITREHLKTIGSHQLATKMAGTYARKILNHLLIDLSWNSSRLEGNTYSLLETDRLFEFGEQPKDKDITETQMILNHKSAIEFLVDYAEEISYNRSTMLNLHALLSDNLLSNPASCGRLRNISVGIRHSKYKPSDIPQLIDECFQQILDIVSKIQDPFEQSFFIMVHLPYLQPFEDVNKRVSRLAANISLIQNNLSPLSFINVPEKAYVEGLLGIYELNKVDLLRDVFVWAYEQSAARYTTARQLLGDPDPFRIKYREQLIKIIGEIVRQCLNVKDSIEYIQTWVINEIPQNDRSRFKEIVETELLNLHEGNFSRFRLKSSEFENWSKDMSWYHIARARKRSLEIEQIWKKKSFNEQESKKWISILEEKKEVDKKGIIFWTDQDIKDFFDLNESAFKDLLTQAKDFLIYNYGLQVINGLNALNHFDDQKLTRYACFSIAKTLEKKEILIKKAEFSQYYFGGYPCNSDSFTNRVKEGKIGGSISLEFGEDSKGFNYFSPIS